MKYFRTAEIARIIGIHPNTVRLYEKWGLLPPIPRRKNGYRIFNQFHLDQIQLARIALNSTFLGGEIRATALAVIRASAKKDFKQALKQAKDHLQLIEKEQIEANKAVEILENWAQDCNSDSNEEVFQIREAANYVHISIDSLRNWERNGLLTVPRDPKNNYRLYRRKELERLQVIRVLRLARYSIMSILRMLTSFDQGHRHKLREILDTPKKEEEIISATDHWQSTLTKLVQKAHNLITQLEQMIAKKFSGY